MCRDIGTSQPQRWKSRAGEEHSKQAQFISTETPHEILSKRWGKSKRCAWEIQLGTSSRAIHGGAYFSAVSGRKFNLTTVLRPCRPLACCWMFFSRPLSLLYWISLNCQVPWGWHCIFRWICLQNAKMDFFPTVLIAFPKTDLDFTDCCMNLFSTMTMFMFLCKYDRPSIILFVVFPSPLKRRSTQSSSCLIFAIK